MPINKQLFLLRKQYDAKSQKLLEVAKKQRGIIESIQEEIYKLELKLESSNNNEEQVSCVQNDPRLYTKIHQNLIKSQSHDQKLHNGKGNKGTVSKFESNNLEGNGSAKMLI